MSPSAIQTTSKEKSSSSSNRAPPDSLGSLLDRLEEAAEERSSISLGDMLETVGRRSYAAILLLVGLLAFSPLSGIPGMPTTLGVLVLLVAGQILLQRDQLWLPAWILQRRIPRPALCRGVRFLRPPAHFLDRVTRPRLSFLTRHLSAYMIIVCCAFIGASMPPLELLPFVATTAGAALTSFALALLVNDGLFALFALLSTGLLVGLSFYFLF